MDSKHGKKKELWPLEYEKLPAELQWDKMEEGIRHKMEELESAPTAPEHKTRWLIWILGSILLIGSLVSVLILLNQAYPFRNDVATKEQTRPLAKATQSDDNRPAPSGQNELNEVAVMGISTSASSPEGESLPASPQNPNNLTLDGSGERQRSLVNESEEPSGDYDAPESEGADTGVSRRENQALSPAATATSPYTVAPLPTQGRLGPVIALTQLDPPSPRVIAHPVASSKTTRRSGPASQLWLLGGASWWTAGYGSVQAERADFESSILSYQGQLSYVVPLKEGFVLLAGLQYQQLRSRLNWETQVDDFEVTLEDTIVQIRRNVFTGEETEVRGDVTLSGAAERRVQHYNRMSFAQIPISIGKIWGADRWQSHLLVGGVLSLPLSVNGRTLYQGEVIDYNNSTSGMIWRDQVSFGATLAAGVSYRFTDHLGIISSVQFQQSLTNWSAEQNVSIRPSILNVAIGLNYSW